MPLSKRQLVNKNSGKVADALISKGYYQFRMTENEDHTLFDVSEYSNIPYSYLRVWEDIIEYCDGDRKRVYEGAPKSKQSILDTFKKAPGL